MVADIQPIDWHLIWPVRSFYARPVAYNSQPVIGKRTSLRMTDASCSQWGYKLQVHDILCNLLFVLAVFSLYFTPSRWALNLLWARMGLRYTRPPEKTTFDIKVGKCFSINLNIYEATTRVKGCTSFWRTFRNVCGCGLIKFDEQIAGRRPHSRHVSQQTWPTL